jgi:hypothetical protein
MHACIASPADAVAHPAVVCLRWLRESIRTHSTAVDHGRSVLHLKHAGGMAAYTHYLTLCLQVQVLPERAVQVLTYELRRQRVQAVLETGEGHGGEDRATAAREVVDHLISPLV